MNGDVLQLDLNLPRDAALDLTVALDEGRPFEDLLGYYELLYDEAHPLRDRTRVILYFPEEAERPGLRAEILLAALGIEDYVLAESRLDREDYQNNYKEYFQPVAVDDRLAIVPEWHRDTPAAAGLLAQGRAPLYLDPGMAFGTGTHPTTRLCLRALARRVQAGQTVVDAGCGSGVLSIGAVLLGAASVFAFDIEENAIQASRHNFGLNADCPERITLVRGGFELPELAAVLDAAALVVANLAAAVLSAHSARLTTGAHRALILSGVWRDHRAAVEDAFLDDWRAERIDEEEGWLLFDLTRA